MSKVTPQLRFPQFADEWQVKKLGDISKVTSGGTPSRTNREYWNGDIPWITTSEINFNSIGSACQFITKDGISNSAAKVFPRGSVLIALYGQGKTRGKVAKLAIDASTNQACGVIIPDTKIISSDYIFQDLSRRYDSLRNLSNDGGQKNLSGQLVKSLSVHLPTLKEQENITGFLAAVDEQVRKIEKKIELLKKYKKGVIQKIFTQQIRFKDENGSMYTDWQEKRLSGILTSKSKDAVSDTSMYRKITVKLRKQGVEFTKQTRKMADTRPFYVRRVGEIIIGKQNYFNGSIAIVKQEFDGCICSNAIMSFYVNSDTNTKFVYEYISQESYLAKREALASGTGQKELSEKDFLTFTIMLPTRDEQQKIADFLTFLDEKIKTEESRLKSTKEWKKGLLQRMFV